MAMPAVVGVGAFGAGQGAVTAAFPTGYTPVADDVGIIFQECENADTPTAPSGGWAIITTQAVASGTTTKLTAYWLRFAGGETAPSVPDPGNHQMSQMIVVSGCKTSGNPWNIFTTSQELTSDTSVSIPGVTTTAADCLILAAFSTGQDVNSSANASGFANASLANVTEQMDRWTAQGLGGGLAMATGEKAAAGATGATTATVGTANFKALMTIALEGVGVTEHQAAATLTGTGTLTAGAAGERPAAATLTGTGTLTAAGALNRDPPSLNTPAESTWTPAAASKTTTVGGDNGTGGLSWAAGDIIVVLAMAADNATTYGTPTATGLTFASLVGPSNTASSCKAQAWSATAAGSGSGAVTLTSNNQNPYGLIAYRISGSDGLGNTNLIVSTAVTASLSTSQDESAVLALTGDWGAAAVAGATPTPALPANWTEREEQQVSGQYSVFGYDWADRDTAATTSYGIGGSYTPSGSNYTKLLIEVLGADAAGGGGTEHQASAALAGTGTLVAAASRDAAASAALNGTGTLSAAATAERPAAAALAGTGTLTAAATRTATLGAALTATATLTAAATLTATAAAALTGTGTLAADATVGAAPVLIQAVLAATGTLTAGALRDATAAAVLTGTGTMSAAAAATLTLTAQLAATGTLTAGLALATSSAATLAATGTLTATAAVAGAYQPAYWSIDSHTSVGALDTHTTTSGHLD